MIRHLTTCANPALPLPQRPKVLMQASRRMRNTAHLCQKCLAGQVAFAARTRLNARPLRRTKGETAAHPPRRTYSTEASVKANYDSVYDDLTRPPAPAPTQSSSSTELPNTDREENIARARVVFGSRLAGPAERKRELEAASTRVAGVVVPPRPEEPDNCCMSGCVNCVWDRYRDEMEEWAAASAQARTRLQAQRQREREERTASRGIDTASGQPAAMPSHIASSMDDDGGGSETNWPAPQDVQGTDLFDEIPVGIREFMRTEKRLREKRKKGR